MPKKLYQCPYERACKCAMDIPCLGCETWAEHYGEFKNDIQQLKAKIADLEKSLSVVCGQSYGDKKLLEVIRSELRQLSAV